MKIFFAAAERKEYLDMLERCDVKNILSSFYWKTDDMDPTKLSGKFNIFCDSGGYSARKNGIEINIENYGKFLDENKDHIFAAANLDVYDLEQSMKNQKYLEQFYPVLPVYHMSEYVSGNRDLLETFCKQYKYIAIGGIAGSTVDNNLLENFFRFCFKTVLKYKTKVHGFGITAPDLLKEYPFYSVDSTTWMSGARFGTMVKWRDNFTMQTSLHYSNKKEFMKHNLDISLTEDYLGRMEQGIKEFLKMERDLTELWRVRGITYND
jgi:hypothetical protein